MYNIPDFAFEHINEANAIGGGACDVFMAVVEFVFY